MKSTAFYFLLAELLDVTTTLIGLEAGLWETNLHYMKEPVAFLILRTLVVVGIAFILQYKKPFKWDILIPIVAFIGPIWNIIVMIVEL